MINKKIHYCWFGRGQKSKIMQKCIDSWKKYCPDYEIIEWNEDNFDIESNKYTKYCYEKKKWAFLSDYVRLVVVHEYGGVYFDTDVEVIKNIDHLLEYEAFFGFENDQYVASGLGFGAEVGHWTLKEMIKQYDKVQLNDEAMLKWPACPELNTKALLPYGLQLNGQRQIINGACILEKEILNPFDDPTGRLNKTKDTVSIHWYSKSWIDRKTVIRSKITRPFHRLFGVDCFKRFKNEKK